MTSASLSYDSLLAELDGAIAQLDDPRKPSNASGYSLRDKASPKYCMQHNGAIGHLHAQHASPSAEAITLGQN